MRLPCGTLKQFPILSHIQTLSFLFFLDRSSLVVYHDATGRIQERKKEKRLSNYFFATSGQSPRDRSPNNPTRRQFPFPLPPSSSAHTCEAAAEEKEEEEGGTPISQKKGGRNFGPPPPPPPVSPPPQASEGVGPKLKLAPTRLDRSLTRADGGLKWAAVVVPPPFVCRPRVFEGSVFSSSLLCARHHTT